MIGKFYGLTGLTLLLSDVTIDVFEKMVLNLDTPTNRNILNSLKIELRKLIEFSENVKYSYEGSEANRAVSILRLKRYKDEDEKERLEKLLESTPRVVSRQYKKEGEGFKEMSEGAYALINYLLKPNIQKILKFYESKIEFSSGESGVKVFGEPLYIFRNRKKSSINYRLDGIYAKYRRKPVTSELISSFKNNVEVLESYCLENRLSNSENKGEEFIESLRSLVEMVDSNFLNYRLSDDRCTINLDRFGYKDLRDELSEIGVHGLTVNGKLFFEDFRKSVSVASEPDVYIYKGMESYDYVLQLRRILDTLLEL